MNTWRYYKNDELPASWVSTPLNYLFKIIGGNGFASELQGNIHGELPFIKNSDISSGAAKISTAANYVTRDLASQEGFNVIPKRSILMGKIGESMKKNRRVLNTVECCIDNNMQAMAPNENLIHPEYGLYALQLLDASVFNNGGPVPSINNVKWKRARIPLPEKREQLLILAVLNRETAKIDHAVELLRQQIETLEQLKKSIIHEAVTKGLDAAVPMKPSGVEWIGDIPEHWEIKRLKYVSSPKTGQTPPSDDASYFDGEITWYTPGDMNNDYVEVSARTLTRKAVVEGQVPWMPAGLTLFVGIGTIGKVGYSRIACSFNQQITALPTENDESEWLFYAMRAQREFIIGHALYTTLPILNNRFLNNLILPMPPVEEQKVIFSFLSRRCLTIDHAVSVKSQQLEVLNLQRQALIFEYVTGKRRVNKVA